jgi:hypothetical protein
VDAPGLHPFLGERDRLRQDVLLLADLDQFLFELFDDLALGGRLGQIGAPVGVDIEFVDTQTPDTLDVGVGLDLEPTAQKAVIQPAAVEVMDIHADTQVGDVDLLDHARAHPKARGGNPSNRAVQAIGARVRLIPAG